MKALLILLISVITMTPAEQSTNFYDYSFIDIDGNEVQLSEFQGKKILIVNVASKCGFTPQYEGLQKLHEQYGENLVIIGFPCNQFLKQEPGGEEEIKSFCQKNYGVDFLMASKIEVKGEGKHPIYKWLTDFTLNGVESTKVSWNFQKYLIDEEGKYVQMFSPKTNPLDPKITALLE